MKRKKKSKYLLFAAVLHTAMKDAVVSPDTQMENNCLRPFFCKTVQIITWVNSACLL